MTRVDSLLDAWSDFFHVPTPPHEIGLFRIAWGGLMLINCLLLARDGNRFFGPRGIFSVECYRQAYGRSRFTLFNLLPDNSLAAPLLLVLHGVAAVGILVGYATQASCVVAFLTLVSLHHRNPAVFHSGDSLMRIMTFLMIFSRAGDAYSLDRWLATAEFNGAAESSSPWCQRLMQLQVSILYLRAAHWKLRGTLWVNGTAAYYPTQIISFQRFRLPAWMQAVPLIRLATWGTVAVQLFMGLGVWVEELRVAALIAGIILHLTFELFLNLQLFGPLMLSTYLLFATPFS